ncbi:MAG TPA: 23S rRNA (adenine(2503)-C(2))-methyltransferase RlmN [Clostridia bacterium]|nr:23S rRNA (adenine(2503)-C(2))-methyltransferase RlmN [Clostridia bacterium]
MNNIDEKNEQQTALKPCLLSMSKVEIGELIKSAPSYVAGQIFQFLHNGKSFLEMSSISKLLREELNKNFLDQPISIEKVFEGKDGTKKFLFRLFDDELIEGVYMHHDYGNTLCVSTQVGCRMGCAFCASGIEGLKRNLTAGEILGQVVAVNAHENGNIKDRAITNVVLMGSGEPLDNYDNTIKFLELVNEKGGICISERNISLSTSGLCDKIDLLSKSGHTPTLTISLHATNDEIRSSIMPINRKYSVREVVASARNYFRQTGRRVIFEYSLISGKNDNLECADALSKLVRGFPCHVNLIKLNPVKELGLSGSSASEAKAFLDRLIENNTSATIRKSLGNDIEGACGQLRRRYVSTDIEKVKKEGIIKSI